MFLDGLKVRSSSTNRSVCQRRSPSWRPQLDGGVGLDRAEALDGDAAAMQVGAQEAVRRAPAGQAQVGRAVGDPLARRRSAPAARRSEPRGPRTPRTASPSAAWSGEDPGVDVQVVAGAAHRRVLGARRAPLAARVEVRAARADRVAGGGDALVGDEVDERRARARLAEELKALDPAGLGHAAQAALGGRVGALGEEAAVDLGGEREAHVGQPGDDLEVDRLGLEPRVARCAAAR